MLTKTLSHYEILASIGEGGMGVVYRALDTRLGRPVALKLLRHDEAITAEGRKRFVHEARAASSLNHPHIVTIYDIGQDRGIDFIAMEYVDGTSLAEMIARGRLSLDQSLTLAVQIADALAAAHANGIYHRDLKPANIMVTGNGSVKVLDFGLAKLAEPTDFNSADDRMTTRAEEVSRVKTEQGTILGTAAYMSPEQVEGKTADARSDVFSFGIVLYEMITGRRAFAGTTKIATCAAVLTAEPEPPGSFVPGLPADLEKIVARCLRKRPERRWQSMLDIKVALEDLREEGAPRPVAALPRASSGTARHVMYGLVGVAIVLGALGIWWQRSTTTEPPKSNPFLKRLTWDLAWTDYPTVSLDGRLLAYASDRSGDANLDIWVQHIPDGPPVRLTHNLAVDVEPSFSSDGSRVAFQSSRDGGAIYIVPTLGGEERLVAPRGFSPRFSPRENWLAYGVAEQGGSRIYVVSADGGPATLVARGFYRMQAPVWSPDGRHLLFWGQRERDAPPERNIDWYVTAVPGGSPVPLGARSQLLREGFEAFQGLPLPDAWAGSPDRIVFHGNVGDSSNLWQVRLSREPWAVSGRPERATFGTTDEAAASVTADGQLVFISRTVGSDIWALPLDINRGKAEGAIQRLTQDAADDYDPTLSDDGTRLVFRSRRGGRFGVVLKRIGSRDETILTRVSVDHYAAISRDGTKVAYSFQQNGKMPVFVVPAGGGTAQQVCDDCGEVKEWLPGGEQLLYVTQRYPSDVGIVTIGTSHNRTWLKNPLYGIYGPRVSADGGWVAFNSRTDRLAPARVFVARIQDNVVAKEWIEISHDADAPSWSPQGGLLYFWSDRDGFPCLWAQRLEPETKRPLGVPLSVHHFHSRGLSWKNLYLGTPGIAVTHDKIVFNLGEHSGNIWMTNLSVPRN